MKNLQRTFPETALTLWGPSEKVLQTLCVRWANKQHTRHLTKAMPSCANVVYIRDAHFTVDPKNGNVITFQITGHWSLRWSEFHFRWYPLCTNHGFHGNTVHVYGQLYTHIHQSGVSR